MAWVWNEQVVVWLLSNKVVGESSTRTLPGALKWIFMAVALLSLMAAGRIFIRPAVSVYRWTPIQALVAYTGRFFSPIAVPMRAVVTVIALAWRRMLAELFTYLWRGVTTIARAAGNTLAYLWVAIATVLGYLWLAVSKTGLATGWVVRYIWLGVSTVLRYLWLGIFTVLKYLWLGIYTVLRYMWLGVSTVLRYLWLGIFTVLKYLWLGIYTVLRYMWMGVSTVLRYLWLGVSTVLRYLWLGIFTVLKYMWMGVSTIAITIGLGLSYLWRCIVIVLRGLGKIFVLAMRTVWTGCATVPDVFKMGFWVIKNRKGGSEMTAFKPTRERLLSLVITTVVFFTIVSIGIRILWPAPPEPTIRVVHWTTGHLTRDGLLKDMAEEFNEAYYRIGSGTRIVVEVYDVPSELQGKYLSELLVFGTRRNLHEETNGYVVENIPDPVIVTPSSAHWLVTTNYEVGYTVVDLGNPENIVRPVIGIVTYEKMARCLGWPEKEIGFADIISLRNDPLGWASYSCADAEWGQRPLLAFTDPTTSSTGRSLYLGLYSIAANKSPGDLTIDDVNAPKVVDYIEEFQSLIDHYLIGTTVLNTKIYQGPRYGHFFIMPEDNLIHLYEGTEKAYVNGVKTTAPPINERMVMIYPKEGSMPRNNIAGIVQAEWVSDEQVEASQEWIDFIREDEQQRAFMAAGFRPGTDLDLNYPGSKISSEFGLNPDEPKVVLNPSLTKPEVAAAIDGSWELVKRSGIVTFVVDTSGSMTGDKIEQARYGLTRALDNMADNNQVGLVTFDDSTNTIIPVRPLQDNRFIIADAVHEMRARGETALYDAIKSGIEMTIAADGEDNAIRAVVVLTDGQANKGSTKLDDIIQMGSRFETSILQFGGMVDDSSALDEKGRMVAKEDVMGTGQLLEADHPIQIFFIGIGDADLEIGRLLSEATGAEYQGVTEEDLANVLEEFSKYF
jgi:Ca-activated chloride channel family protein